MYLTSEGPKSLRYQFGVLLADYVNIIENASTGFI